MATIEQISPWISAAKDMVVGLAAAAAAVFAFLGLSTWRTELKGRSEYQLAKDVLKSVYKVRDAFMHVRNPAIFRFEYPEEMTDRTGHLKRECRYDGTAHVYDQRWKHLAEAFGELDEYHLAAQVEWGPEFRDRIVGLRKCRAELQIAIQQMLDALKGDDGGYTNAERPDWGPVLYYIGSTSRHDRLTPQIDAAINEFETWLRPYVKSRWRR